MASRDSKEDLGLIGFSDAKAYERLRTDYPRKAVQSMMKKIGVLNEDGSPVSRTFRILELGAGTGKFTRVMKDVLKDAHNVHIVASDPAKGMCLKFRELLPGIEMKEFAADNIGFADASFDAVIAACSLHWFCSEKSFNEISRVLVPEGKFGISMIILNVSDSGWQHEICKYLDHFYKRNSIIWASLHVKELMEQIPRDKFTVLLDSDISHLSMEADAERVFEYLSSYSVVACFTQEEQVEFRHFYQLIVNRYFKGQGIEMKSLEFVSWIEVCEKI